MRERRARDGAAHASILRLDRFTVLNTRNLRNGRGDSGDSVFAAQADGDEASNDGSRVAASCGGARAGGTERGSMIGRILTS